ncbi:MAG: response regulator transcription factor [Lachnospiraceae bacterium]|nr:response regulator transcription factor [Lachnospiraceae bacterium]
MKILIAEDTADLNRVVTVMLQHAGYEVDSVYDGEAALEQIDRNGYDAVILDIMMPRMDGITALKTIRAKGITVPVLLLTAKAEIDDRVNGLDAGADDYLPKPFAMKELLARVNAMTRRRIQYASRRLDLNGFSLDTETLALTARNTVRLSMKECELLQLFMQNPERDLGVPYILTHVWAGDGNADQDTVELYVRYLQRKLASTIAPAHMEGSRGKTYRLVLSEVETDDRT